MNLKGRDAARSYAAPALCADIDGFRLHAAVRCAANDRQALEQMYGYIPRPALAKERVQTNAALSQSVTEKSSPTFQPAGVGAFSFSDVGVHERDLFKNGPFDHSDV